MEISRQILWLFLLALPIACISWTFTQETIFREPREYCANRSLSDKNILTRKFFYIFTCEYCFSHYITIIFLFITDYQLLFTGWRGYLVAGFSLVWIANLYMNIYALIRQNIKKEKTEIKMLEKEVKEVKEKP